MIIRRNASSSTEEDYLYRAVISYFRGKGKVVLPFGTTGIAATNLRGGLTVRKGFGLPACLLIIDEIRKEGLRCIDTLLREIMGNEKPFGGKVFIRRGDFRQTSSS
ncbi:hypothetical protein J437_LFUL016348 [Ladona fulva]|uniref:ATP-dependent DNA helicase n=1 Tax=Ladona fulva TaxID=123851 RepID=A0A8K0P9X4_LADFU|nr:hypothetical protein J437_LFUL016348 [Ladona fulva]